MEIGIVLLVGMLGLAISKWMAVALLLLFLFLKLLQYKRDEEQWLRYFKEKSTIHLFTGFVLFLLAGIGIVGACDVWLFSVLGYPQAGATALFLVAITMVVRFVSVWKNRKQITEKLIQAQSKMYQ